MYRCSMKSNLMAQNVFNKIYNIIGNHLTISSKINYYSAMLNTLLKIN